MESTCHPGRKYIGLTRNLKTRLADHNSGKSPFTAKSVPWKIVAAIWFEQEKKARQFEKYLKNGSGYAFAKKHFWKES